MSFLKALFGPSQQEIWRELSNQIGADFHERSFWKGAKVVARVKEWTVTLDTYRVSTGKHTVVYTRLRAPYVNPHGFRFTIYRKSLFSGLGKKLGMQDIDIGEPAFDDQFIIKGTDPEKVRALFRHAPLRRLLEAQPKVLMKVKDNEGRFGTAFPAEVDELYFLAHGVIKEVAQLKGLYDLFAVTLHCLCHIGEAYESDPQLKLD